MNDLLCCFCIRLAVAYNAFTHREERMTATVSDKRKRSTYIDVDVLTWLEARGAVLDRSVDWQIREILRAAMDAERRQEGEAA